MATEWLQFVDKSDLEEVEKNILDKIKSLSKEYCLMDCEEFHCIRLIWNLLEKETLDEYIKRQIEQPINIPKLLLLVANVWTGSRGRGWSFDAKRFEGYYLSAKEAYDKTISLKATKEFLELNKPFKEIAVAFSMWYKQEKTGFNKISQADVETELSEWLPVEH